MTGLIGWTGGGPPKGNPTLRLKFGQPAAGEPATTFTLGLRFDDTTYYRPFQASGSFAWAASGRKVVPGGGREPRANVDPDDLAEAGWGILWADEATRDEAAPHLAPLLEHRRKEAGDRFLERVHVVGRSARAFLDGEGDVPGPADEAPYYLLLVGDPQVLPFEFQQQLDLRYAVGRLHFDTPEAYASYAASVVASEKKAARLERRALFFGVEHENDPATQQCVKQLIEPLAAETARRKGWSTEFVLGANATRSALLGRLSSGPPPAVLVTAGHSPVLGKGSADQEAYQGALVTADWPDPDAEKPLGPEHLFAARDLGGSVDLAGTISILVGCFTAGTPRFDGFAREEPEELAEAPFVAHLPQALLSRGALAAVAHVDSLYLHSFAWPGSAAKPQHKTYGDMLHHLMAGHRLGHAMDTFGRRYGEMADYLLGARMNPSSIDEATYSAYWIGYHDARQFVVLGDPAVRLALKED
ncbi:MAG: hypothetical protein MI919_00740 [Holophagales bacterium]|nr:hypothetical protein [Holophagales bacterium]